MTIRLSPSQVECLNQMKRGLKTTPPLLPRSVTALVRLGYAYEMTVAGSIYFFLTDRGRDFLAR